MKVADLCILSCS